jgi:hypothetical protein
MPLKHHGCEGVRLYSGGGSHSSNALTLPVVEGHPLFDEAFSL